MQDTFTKYRRLLIPSSLCILFFILYGPLFFRQVVFYSADSYAFYFTQLRYWFGELAANHSIAFWNPYIYLGTSFLYNTTNALFYPFHALGLILPPLVLYQVLWVMHLALFATAIARWGRRAGASFANQMMVTLLFVGAPFTSLFGTAGYNYLYAMTWAAWILSELEGSAAPRSFLRLLLFWGLLLFSGEPFTAISLGAFLSYFLYSKGDKRQVLFFWAVTLALGILIYGHALLALAYSTRSAGLPTQIILSFSFHPLRLLTFLSPYFFGHPLRETFGNSFVNSAPGVPRFLFDTPFLPTVLLLLILLGVRKSWKQRTSLPWLVGMTAAFVLSFGNFGPLQWLCHIPPFSMFRYPEKFTIIGVLFAVHFAFRSNDDFLAELKSPFVKLILLASIALTCVSRDNELPIAITCAGLLLALVLYEKQRISHTRFMVVALLTGVAQCWWSLSPERTIAIAEIEKEVPVAAYVKSVISEGSLERFEITPHVVRSEFPHRYLIYGTNMLFHRATLFGYDSFMTPFVQSSMRRLTGENSRFETGILPVLKADAVLALTRLTALNMLVVADDSPIQSLFEAVSEDAKVFRVAHHEENWTALAPYSPSSALWWFSDLGVNDPARDQLHWPPTVKKDRAFFRGVEWDWDKVKTVHCPQSNAESDPKRGRQFDPHAIKWTGDNEFRFQFQTDCEGWVFFSQSMLPGWRLFIDDQQQPLYRANGTFMAFQVPAGQITGYLKYAPFQTLYEGFVGRFINPL